MIRNIIVMFLFMGLSRCDYAAGLNLGESHTHEGVTITLQKKGVVHITGMGMPLRERNLSEYAGEWRVLYRSDEFTIQGKLEELLGFIPAGEGLYILDIKVVEAEIPP